MEKWSRPILISHPRICLARQGNTPHQASQSALSMQQTPGPESRESGSKYRRLNVVWRADCGMLTIWKEVRGPAGPHHRRKAVRVHRSQVAVRRSHFAVRSSQFAATSALRHAHTQFPVDTHTYSCHTVCIALQRLLCLHRKWYLQHWRFRLVPIKTRPNICATRDGFRDVTRQTVDQLTY